MAQVYLGVIHLREHGGEELAAGEWLRDDAAPDDMSSLEFLDRFYALGLYPALWAARNAGWQVDYAMERGIAAGTVSLIGSFQHLQALEGQGIFPAGTAMRVWGGMGG